MNSEELEQSLKAEFENHLGSMIADIKQEVAEFQSRVRTDLEHQRERMDEAFRSFAERFDSKGGMNAGFGELVSEHLKLARDEGAKLAANAYDEAERIEPTPAGSPTGFVELRDAIADVTSKDSQSAILTSLVDHAAKFAPRGAFFIVKSDQLAGWKVFGDESAEHAVREIHFPVSDNSILGRASESRSTVEASFGNHEGDSAFLDPLNFGRPDRMYAIPLVARGRGVAVLYADHGNDGAALNLEGLETLVKIAGMTVELLAAAHAPAEEATPVESHQPAAAPASDFAFSDSVAVQGGFPSAVEEEAVETVSDGSPFDDRAVEEHSFEPVSEPAYHESPQPEHPYAGSPVPEPEPQPETRPEYETASGAMVFDSGGSIEPATETSPFERTVAPFEPVSPIGGGMSRSIEPAMEVAAPTATARPRLSDRPVDLPIEVPEEERRLHNDARRFARLLVSEIKLYNEKKVLEGRQAHDLYDRLKEAIDRSREMYDKRVQPPVAAKFDYFHYELVNSLAEGDPQRFGSGYPGATV